MTKLEMQALLLASEIEQMIKSGLHAPSNVVLALNQFRIAQDEENKRIGNELEEMYKQHLESINQVKN